MIIGVRIHTYMRKHKNRHTHTYAYAYSYARTCKEGEDVLLNVRKRGNRLTHSGLAKDVAIVSHGATARGKERNGEGKSVTGR